MGQVQIQTAQNVTIEYKVASVGDRILAELLDTLIVGSYLIGIYILLGALTPAFDVTLAILAFLPYAFYHLVCELFMDGQSFGKKVMRTKVVKLDGSQPSLGSYLLRWMLRLIDLQLLSGAIAIVTIVINGKGQRLGDMAAGTCVVKLDQPTTLRETIFQAVDEDYTVVFPQVERLTDEDIATVKAVIEANYGSKPSLNVKNMTRKAQEALEAKMGIQTDATPLSFLRTVLKDYNHLMGRLD